MNHARVATTAWTALLFIVTAAVVGTFAMGCTDDNSIKVVTYSVCRENVDRTHTCWHTTNVPELKEGFVCWETGVPDLDMCISGTITIIPKILIQPVIPKEN